MLAVTIRLATDSDRSQLQRLAERDTRALPDGQLLVAERGGAIDAALSLATGEAVADPFKRTVELVELLQAHAERRDASPSAAMPRKGLTPRLAGGWL
ncbi:MAG TPA: hypothetical protein VHF58_07950 [Solirubrobacterales bacterium]|nr:hypothetical protein [Solirubrobacterales bacterium]